MRTEILPWQNEMKAHDVKTWPPNVGIFRNIKNDKLLLKSPNKWPWLILTVSSRTIVTINTKYIFIKYFEILKIFIHQTTKPEVSFCYFVVRLLFCRIREKSLLFFLSSSIFASYKKHIDAGVKDSYFRGGSGVCGPPVSRGGEAPEFKWF